MHVFINTDLGNHTFGIVKGSESYEYLSASLHSLFDDINSVIAEGVITVGDHQVELEFVLGSDYKVFQVYCYHFNVHFCNLLVPPYVYGYERCHQQLLLFMV